MLSVYKIRIIFRISNINRLIIASANTVINAIRKKFFIFSLVINCTLLFKKQATGGLQNGV